MCDLGLARFVHSFGTDFLCVPFASLRLCGEELDLEISMDAPGPENAVGIERTLEFLVDGEQPRRELLDAVALVATPEQGSVSAGLVRGLECRRRIEVCGNPPQAAVPFHHLLAQTERGGGSFNRETP